MRNPLGLTHSYIKVGPFKAAAILNGKSPVMMALSNEPKKKSEPAAKKSAVATKGAARASSDSASGWNPSARKSASTKAAEAARGPTNAKAVSCVLPFLAPSFLSADVGLFLRRRGGGSTSRTPASAAGAAAMARNAGPKPPAKKAAASGGRQTCLAQYAYPGPGQWKATSSIQAMPMPGGR